MLLTQGKKIRLRRLFRCDVDISIVSALGIHFVYWVYGQLKNWLNLNVTFFKGLQSLSFFKLKLKDILENMTGLKVLKQQKYG